MFLPFHTVHGVLKARILKWFAIPFSSGPHSVRPLHHDPSVLGGPTHHGLVSLSMETHSSTLAWKILWTEEPGGLQSMGSLRVRQLSKFTFTFHFHALEKEMATHSSILAWRILWTEEPGGLQFTGLQRGEHN